MSFADKAIETRVAQIVPTDAAQDAHAADPAKARVLVISRTPELGRAMATNMADDPEVEGLLAQGSLSSVVARQDVWEDVSFVAFELGVDLDEDLEALTALNMDGDIDVQVVAMTAEPVDDLTRQLYEAAGVREILKVSVTTETPAAPKPTAESDCQMEPAAEAPTKAGKITVMLRARGGAGASTLAVNLAVARAAQDTAARTALVDLDIQNGAVSLMLDLPESEHATALARGTATPDAAFLDKAMVRHVSGVDVLTAPDVFAPLTALAPDTLDALLAGLQARYDTIILDMPQGIVDWIEPVLARATRVLLVSDTSLPSVKRTRRLIDLLGEEHMTLPVEVVINQHKKPMVMSNTLKEVETLIGRPLAHWVPADIKAAQRATDMGQPLQTTARRSALTRAIIALGETLFTAPAES